MSGTIPTCHIQHLHFQFIVGPLAGRDLPLPVEHGPPPDHAHLWAVIDLSASLQSLDERKYGLLHGLARMDAGS